MRGGGSPRQARLFRRARPAQRPALYATDNDDWFGSYLRNSDDFGQTWQEPERGIQFPEDSGASSKIWDDRAGTGERAGDGLRRGGPREPVGEPRPWRRRGSSNTGLESHPTREHWNPGAGGICLHTIVPDYSNPKRMWLGISAAGCHRTEDGGESGPSPTRARAGLRAGEYPDFGQCLHRMVQHPTNPTCCISRTTAASISPPTPATNGRTSRGHCPRISASPSRWTPAPDSLHARREAEGAQRQRSVLDLSHARGGEHWEPLTKGCRRPGRQARGAAPRHDQR